MHTRSLYYGAPINRSNPLMRGLVSRWKVVPWYASGPRFIDLGGFGNHGTLTGTAAWSSSLGRPGGVGSITTPGSATNWVTMGTIPGVDTATACSTSCWVYRAATADTAGFGFSAGSVSSGSRLSTIWFSDGNLYTNVDLAYGYCALAGTGWHHITLVFNGSGAGNSTRLLVYIDGVNKTLTFSGTIPATLGACNPFGVGRDSSNRYTKGNYDDALVFPGLVLSDSLVYQLYQATRQQYDPTLNWIDEDYWLAPNADIPVTYNLMPQICM